MPSDGPTREYRHAAGSLLLECWSVPLQDFKSSFIDKPQWQCTPSLEVKRLQHFNTSTAHAVQKGVSKKWKKEKSLESQPMLIKYNNVSILPPAQLYFYSSLSLWWKSEKLFNMWLSSFIEIFKNHIKKHCIFILIKVKQNCQESHEGLINRKLTCSSLRQAHWC